MNRKQTNNLAFRHGNYYYIKNISQNQYLSIKKQQKNFIKQKLNLQKLDRMELSQIWMIEQVSQDKFQIINPFTSTVLQLIQENIQSKQNKIKNSQLFWLENVPQNFQDVQNRNLYFIKQHKSSKKCFYALQNQIKCQQQHLFLNQCNKWQIQLIKNHLLIDQTCFIENCRSNMVLEVLNGSQKQQEKIVQNNLNRCFSQRWSFIKNNNCYMIKNLRSGFFLDIKGQKKKQGTNVIQYKNKNSQNQKWILQCHGKNIYIIRSLLDRTLMLGIKGNSLKQQSQLIVTHNQLEAFWRIVGNIQQK